MPAISPDLSPASHPAPSTALAGSDQLAWLRWFTPYVRRTVLWLGVTAIGTYAMGSAANHIFSKDTKDKEANVASSASAPGGQGTSRYGIWWNPIMDPVDASSKGSGVTFAASPSSSSNGHSIIPVERNAGFSSGSLMVNTPVMIGSNSSREAYSLLGLGTKSFTASAGTLSLGTGSVNSSQLHFSLGGDLNAVPVDNLAAGGLSVATIVAVPEPSTAGLLSMGLAGLAFRRRRRQPAANA